MAALEPGTAPPLQRLRAVRELVDAGVRAGVLMNPIVPASRRRPALIERTMKAIADHGAHFVGCNVMHLEGGTRDHFMRWLDARASRSSWTATSRLYARKYAPAAYRKDVESVLTALRDEVRVESRARDGRRRHRRLSRRRQFAESDFDFTTQTAIASGSAPPPAAGRRPRRTI